MKIVAGISIERSHSDDNHSYLVLPYLENTLAPGKIEQVENNTIENRFLILYNPETKKFTLPVLDSPDKLIYMLTRYMDIIDFTKHRQSFDWPDTEPLNKLAADPEKYIITLVD